MRNVKKINPLILDKFSDQRSAVLMLLSRTHCDGVVPVQSEHASFLSTLTWGNCDGWRDARQGLVMDTRVQQFATHSNNL